MVEITAEQEAVNKGVITKIYCANDTSQHVFIAKDAVGLDLVISSGTATVEQTSGLPSEIRSGTTTWFPWGPGTVGASVASAVWGATAVRLVAPAGVASLYVRT